MRSSYKIESALAAVLICSAALAEDLAETNTALNVRQKAIIPIAAFTASGDLQKLEVSLNEGLDAGLTVNEIKEILIHSHAYVGFPRALNGINQFIDVMEQRKTKGIEDPIGKEAAPIPLDFDSNATGHRVRNGLVGRDISNRTTGYAAFTPAIDRFLVEHLFGDLFARDVVTHKERELITISLLAALPGTDPQLKGHLGISMRMGWSKEQLKEYVSVLQNRVSETSAERAAALLRDVSGAPPKPAIPESLVVTRKIPAVQAPAKYFTGNVTVESRFASQNPKTYGGAIVNFEAGARTAWHTHPHGQTLVIISGKGRVQSDGESIQEISVGDVVWIPANELHWHGAAPESAMSHVAISTPINDETVEWMEKVSNEQYGE